MKFTKEQQDYIKNACEHFEVLTGGRGHSKTKKVIEDMQQEIERLNNIINELEKLELYEFEPDYDYEENLVEHYTPFNIKEYIQELKGDSSNE